MNLNQAVFNLWHLKRTNGMYYFGVDYARRLPCEWTVWVRRGFPVESLQTAGFTRIHVLGFWAYLSVLSTARSQRRPVFCPTSHPIPFLGPQMVVVHDSYPFRTGVGRLKAWLLKTAVRLGRVHVGYINRTDSRRFVAALGVPLDRMHHVPNHVEEHVDIDMSRLARPLGRLVVGLIGTDSSKKRYALLFDAVRGMPGLSQHLIFKTYGHATAYFTSLRADYADLEIDLSASDSLDMIDFLKTVDVVVSVAEGEGFSRPVARALAVGIPCYLLDDEVFREFYDGYASLFDSVQALVQGIEKKATSLNTHEPLGHRFPPKQLIEEFSEAVKVVEAVLAGGAP